MTSPHDTAGPSGPNTVEIGTRDGTTVLTLGGELDCSMATSVRDRIDGLDGDVDVDCAGLRFMDCAGVNLLFEMNQDCQARSAKLTVVNAPQCVTRLLALTRLDGVVDVRSRVPGR